MPAKGLRSAAVVHDPHPLGLRLGADNFTEEGQIDSARLIRVERCHRRLQRLDWINAARPDLSTPTRLVIARSLNTSCSDVPMAIAFSSLNAAVGEALLEQRHHAGRVRCRHRGAGQHQVLAAR